MLIPNGTTALVQELDRRDDSYPIFPTIVSISSGSNDISIEIFNDRSKGMHIRHDEILGNLFAVNMVSVSSLSSTSLFDDFDSDTNEFLNQFNYNHLNHKQTLHLKKVSCRKQSFFCYDGLY